VLEGSGLVSTQKVGRVRTCRLETQRLDAIEAWIDARRQTWERRLDRIGQVLDGSIEASTTDPRPGEAPDQPSEEDAR